MTISDNITIILNDIQSLQVLEQEMFSNLELSPNLTLNQQKEIIQKINQISQMRINLYETLASLNKSYESLLVNSDQNLNEQTVAVQIVEKELNQAKTNLQKIQDQNNNQVRLIEINNYYSQKYSHHTKIFQIVILILLAYILLFWFRNSAYLPSWLFTGLFVLITIVGLWFLLPVLYTVWIRDNMMYDEYYWAFDASNAPVASSNTTQNQVDPWDTTNMGPICEGQECCDVGSTYDPSLNICVPNAKNQCSTNTNTNTKIISNDPNNFNLYNTISKNISSGIYNVSSNVNSGISGVTRYYTENFENNDPVLDALTRPERENRYKKPDVTLGWSPEPSAGRSFVQFNGF
jgi:hypothetical protein